MEEFVALLEKLEADIGSLSVEELTEARTKINEYGLTLRDAEVEDPDQLNTDATALGDAMDRIDAELTTRETVAAEAKEARDIAFAKFDKPEVVEEPAEAVTEEPAEEEAAPVVAAAPALADIAARRPVNTPTPEPVDEPVVASAVGENGNGGSPYKDAATMARAIWDAKNRGPMGSQTVARIDLGHKYVAMGDPLDNWSMLQNIESGVQQVRRETLGTKDQATALTAAGFCAPAEPVYSFLQQGSTEGIIDLPVVTARRGRLTYPEIRNIRDLQVENGVGWETTSTMDEDAVEKPCLTIACVDGATFDVNAYSTCLRYSNFDSQFWPERVTYVSGQSLIAHDHEVNLALILAIVADGRVTTVIDGHLLGGTVLQLVNSLAQHGTYTRGRFRLPIDSVLEVAIPSYVLDACISDITARASTTTYGNARAEIEAIFTRMRINVQWVYDWQEMPDANWPADYDYLLWPAGALVQLSGGTLDLGVTRDSTLNVANDFQVFSETFDGHAVIGSGVTVVTGVNLCPNGAAAALVTVDCAAGS